MNVFTRGYFPTVYEPTVFENYVHGTPNFQPHTSLSDDGKPPRNPVHDVLPRTILLTPH